MSIYERADSIHFCDSVLNSSGLDQSEIDFYKLNRTNLLNQIQQITTFINQAFHSLDSARENRVDFLNGQNDLINSSETYEQNEHIVNNIFLSCIATENPENINQYTDRLFNVAQQCPLSGGPAVYRARSLYMLIDPDMEYMDDLICIQNGWMLRKGISN